MKILSLFALLTGCSKPQPPKVADLHFPVAVLYSNGSNVTYTDAADLGVMRVGHVLATGDLPVLIDSDFKIYTLEKLQSTHGGLWLMANPVGNTEVTFDLKRAEKSGADAAREIFRTRLDQQTWRTDLGEKRKSLAGQTTLDGMLSALRAEQQ